MTSKIYRAIETPVVFTDSGGDVAFAIASLAHDSAGGVVSAQWDRGAGSLPADYKWEIVTQYATAPIVGEYAELYLVEGRGTTAATIDGYLTPTGAASIAAAVKPNLQLLGLCVAQTTGTSATSINVRSGMCTILDRYVQIALWLGGTGATGHLGGANASYVTLTPMPPEVQ